MSVCVCTRVPRNWCARMRSHSHWNRVELRVRFVRFAAAAMLDEGLTLGVWDGVIVTPWVICVVTDVYIHSA